MPRHVKLGLNIDHVATVRQARRGLEPNLVQAARDGIRGGAKGITTHLREDRRHIQDADLSALQRKIRVPLNLEMAASSEMVRIACRLRPEKACLVPEKRQELTTEGGLDVLGSLGRITKAVTRLRKSGIEVSLFIDPDPQQIVAARRAGADYVELHTGTYANKKGVAQKRELAKLRTGAVLAHALGLGVNAGHGLDYKNVRAVAKLPYMEELNIGHSIVSRAIFTGLREASRQMVKLIRS